MQLIQNLFCYDLSHWLSCNADFEGWEKSTSHLHKIMRSFERSTARETMASRLETSRVDVVNLNNPVHTRDGVHADCENQPKLLPKGLNNVPCFGFVSAKH